MKQKIETKKLVYISLSFSTYKNKIKGQIDAWKSKGYLSELLSIETESNGSYSLIKYTFDKKIHRVFVYEGKSKKEVFKELGRIVTNDYNSSEILIYIRRLGINIVYFGKYLSKLSSKIIYEIPTFPIDTGTSFIKRLGLYCENFFLNYYVYPKAELIPVFVQAKDSKLKEKFFPLQNAVVVENEISKINNVNNDSFNFVFFGNLQKWHGLQKFISEFLVFEGENVILSIYSSETDEFKFLKNKYKSENNIFFYDAISLLELENKLDGNVIGIGGLDYESRGADIDTSLKNKDYTALGIPFIYKLTDLSFINYKYGLKISNTDFNGKLIIKIISWYKSIHYPGMNQEIKDYAIQYLTYDKQIELILRKLNKCNIFQ